MAEHWSPEEVAATVADYVEMLKRELRGEPYIKAEHNRRLQQLLNGRSGAAVEFKHANISAILHDIGFPSIDGYKPRSNYQELLRAEVEARLDSDQELILLASTIVDAPVSEPQVLQSWQDVFVPAPQREDRQLYERRNPLPVTPRQVNFLEREARNALLGRAGEEFVLQLEHRRLWELNMRRLADRIEHVSATRGDGLGYDIVSFETDGRERLIEVKTTTFGRMTPFFASAREVTVSEAEANYYHLYRVFRFREQPKVFSLQGAIRDSCRLDATEYRASLV